MMSLGTRAELGENLGTRHGSGDGNGSCSHDVHSFYVQCRRLDNALSSYRYGAATTTTITAVVDTTTTTKSSQQQHARIPFPSCFSVATTAQPKAVFCCAVGGGSE
jgi:hypothetical protein